MNAQKPKNKHLKLNQYECLIKAIIKFNAFNHKKRIVGTYVSNIYPLINPEIMIVKDTQFKYRVALSAYAAFNKRSNE